MTDRDRAAPSSKTVGAGVSALGRVTLSREYFWHPTEGGTFLAAEVLGLGGFLTLQARRLVTLAGDASASRIESGRRALLAEGKPGLDRWLARAFGEVPVGVSSDPLIALAAYVAKHPTRLSHAQRLASGRSIGSGAVEGAIKQQVNLRMKRTGARWCVEHVGPLVELRVMSQTSSWPTLWTAA